MSMVPSGPPAPPSLPGGGVFAASEVVPLLAAAKREVDSRIAEWQRLREDANEKKARAKKVRADYLVSLRVWGILETGGIPIKTAVERNEWADANPDIQQAELEADLAQTVQMAAKESLDIAASHYETLRQALAVERDDLKRGWNGDPSGTPF